MKIIRKCDDLVNNSRPADSLFTESPTFIRDIIFISRYENYQEMWWFGKQLSSSGLVVYRITNIHSWHNFHIKETQLDIPIYYLWVHWNLFRNVLYYTKVYESKYVTNNEALILSYIFQLFIVYFCPS